MASCAAGFSPAQVAQAVATQATGIAAVAARCTWAWDRRADAHGVTLRSE